MNRLTLSITNLDQLQPNVTARHQFDYKGGTIGSGGASWRLTDREQTVAPIHCEIRWIEDSFCVIDRCHRTYLNESINCLGSLSPRRLLEGDQLRIGAYRLQVRYSQDQADTRSLENLLNPDPRVLDRLIADVPANAWQGKSPDIQTAAEICSVFESSMGNDPLAVLDAVADAQASQENPLQGLIAGERP